MFSLIFQQLYTELQGHFFKLNSNFSEVKPESYDALIIPGGRFTELLSADDKVLGIVSNFSQAGKPIATTCHSQLLLVATGFIKGKKCTAFPSMKPLVTLAGGVWMDPEPITSCVLDGNIISAIGWPAHAEYLNLLLRSMGAKISGSQNKAIIFLCGVGFLYSSVNQIDKKINLKEQLPYKFHDSPLSRTIHQVDPTNSLPSSPPLKPWHVYLGPFCEFYFSVLFKVMIFGRTESIIFQGLCWSLLPLIPWNCNLQYISSKSCFDLLYT